MPENIDDFMVAGIALAPLVSILISMMKEVWKIKSESIPVINLLLGVICVIVYGVFTQDLSLFQSLVMTLGVVFGSQLFHETFGHAGNLIKEHFFTRN